MIQESIRQLCAVSIFCGAAINITPEGGVRRIMQLLCTAALTIAILSPIKEIDFDIYALETARLREAEAAINERRAVRGIYIGQSGRAWGGRFRSESPGAVEP